MSNAVGRLHQGQPVCLNAPNGNTERDGGLEVSGKLFDLVVFYSQNLAVPPRRNFDDPQVLRGKALFYALGCQSCHTPSFTTGEVKDQPHLSDQKIWPYYRPAAARHGRGSRRQPARRRRRRARMAHAAAVGHRPDASSSAGTRFFLHDGRARNLEEAILWHGGEAQAARDGYAALSKADREALIKFVESL